MLIDLTRQGLLTSDLLVYNYIRTFRSLVTLVKNDKCCSSHRPEIKLASNTELF